MFDAGVPATMSPEKPPKKGPKAKATRGRPRSLDPVRSIVSLKGTAEFEAWLDGLVDHTHQGTRALLLKNALREFAENHRYERQQPKR